MQRLIGRWPFYAAIFFALLPFGAGPTGASEGSGIRQLVWSVIFVSALTVFFRRPAWIREGLRAIPVTFLLLLLYMGLSVIWSPASFVSLKRFIQIVGVLIIAVAVSIGSNGESRIHRLLTPVLLIAMFLAIVFTVKFQNYAYAQNGFRAFMATKNNFGQFAAFAIVFGFGSFIIDKQGRSRTLLLGFMGVIALLFSRSATSAICLLVVAILFFLWWMVFNHNRLWMAIGTVVSMVVVLVSHILGVAYGYPSLNAILVAIANLAGRDTSLTGRTYLWSLMLREITYHPWFGVGYGGFWLGLEGASGMISWRVGWGYPGQAHNGYLDILNELGAVGLLLVLLFLMQHIYNIFVLARKDQHLAMLHGSLCIMLLVLNLAEATLLRTTHLWWIVFIASVVEVRRLSAYTDDGTVTTETDFKINGAYAR